MSSNVKIRVLKKSGRPFDPEDEIKYKDDWRTAYDKAEKRCGTNYVKLQRMLSFIEFLLCKKYFKDVFVSDLKQLEELIVEQKYAPVSAYITESNEMIFIIQDI